MKIKCIVIDDTIEVREIIKHFSEQIPEIEIIGEFDNGLSALSLINKQIADLLIIDIDMPHISGIELIKTLSYKPKIIIISGYKDYALDAYELDVIDYLLKPFSFTRFLKAINKAFGNQFGESLSHDENTRSTFFKVGKKEIKVVLNDILYIQSFGNYCKVFKSNGKVEIVNDTLAKLETVLSANEFMRIHKSYIVPFSKIEKIERTKLVINELSIPIGLSFQRKFLELFEKFKNQVS